MLPTLRFQKLLWVAGVLLVAFPHHSAAAAKVNVFGFEQDVERIGVTPAQFKDLSYVIDFSIEPPTNGNVSLDYVGGQILTQALADLLISGQSTGTGVILGVGGSGKSANFAPMISGGYAQTFATSAAAFCDTNGLAGMDIDWEFPTDNGAGMNTLAGDLQTAFHKATKTHPNGMIITASVHGSNSSYYGSSLSKFDDLLIMSYDNGSPNSSYDQGVASLNLYAPLVSAKSKLVLGVPFFGTQAGTYDGPTYATILAQNPSLSPTADAIAGYSFNGTTTLAQKTAYVVSNGYGGIMIWEVTGDAPDNRLLTSIYNAIYANNGTLAQTPVAILRPAAAYKRIHLLADGNFLTLQTGLSGDYQLTLMVPSGRKTWSAKASSDASGAVHWRASGLPAGEYVYRVQGAAMQTSGFIALPK